MPRTARIVVPGTPHHIIQRGNRRQRTFFSNADYSGYLHIAAEAFGSASVSVWSYCLMPNHVHLIAVPPDERALADAVGATHLKYARMINQREGWTGSIWQGRFRSFPMDDAYFINCAKYVGLNPVRAGLVMRATDWPWSSVRAHLYGKADPLVAVEPLHARVGAEMISFFDEDVETAVLGDIRQAAVRGTPLRMGPRQKLRVNAAA